MEKPEIRGRVIQRRTRAVSSFLFVRDNPQHRLRRLRALAENAEIERSLEEQIVIAPGQIKLWQR